jgi:hypothetical protein
VIIELNSGMILAAITSFSNSTYQRARERSPDLGAVYDKPTTNIAKVALSKEGLEPAVSPVVG